MQHALGVYLGAITLLTLLFGAGLITIAYTQGAPDALLILIGILRIAGRQSIGARSW